MRGVSPLDTRSAFDEMVRNFLGDSGPRWNGGAGYEVPTDVFHLDDKLVIRMDLPGVDPNEVEVTVQENTLLINGTRRFNWDVDKIRWVRRGTFYGDFTQRVSLGKGLNLGGINARFDNGVLELSIPYAEEVQPRRISIDVGDQAALSS